MLRINLVESLLCRGFLRLPGFRSPYPSSRFSAAFRPLCPSFFISCSLCHASQNPRRQGERREDPFEDSSSLSPPLFLDIAPISLSLSVGRRPTKGQGDAKYGQFSGVFQRNGFRQIARLRTFWDCSRPQYDTRSGGGHQIEKREGGERERQKEMAAAAAAAGHGHRPKEGKGAEPDQRNTACIQPQRKEGLYLSLEHLSKRDAASTETSFSMQ